MPCPFCSIVAGEIPSYKLWEDNDFLLFLDITPINPGHVLLIPKEHADDVFKLPDPLYAKLFQTAKKIAPKLQKATEAKRIGLSVEGFGVPHVHVHLIPINHGHEMDPARAKSASGEDLTAMQEKIKAQIVAD